MALPIVGVGADAVTAEPSGISASAGPRVGIEAQHGDLVVGADVRLAFARSPLIITPSFDYYFTGEETLFHIGVRAVYAVTGPRLFAPYAGIGLGVTRFDAGSDEGSGPGTDPDMTDAHGARVGLDLLGGVCFDLPFVAPYVEIAAGLSAIDLVTVSAGLRVRIDGGGGGWDGCGRRRETKEVR